jgi:hypothetical protein
MDSPRGSPLSRGQHSTSTTAAVRSRAGAGEAHAAASSRAGEAHHRQENDLRTPTGASTSSSASGMDRFIPSRQASNLGGLPLLETDERPSQNTDGDDSASVAYSNLLRTEYLGEGPPPCHNPQLPNHFMCVAASYCHAKSRCSQRCQGLMRAAWGRAIAAASPQGLGSPDKGLASPLADPNGVFSPGRSILRYKAESGFKPGLMQESPYSLSPLPGGDADTLPASSSSLRRVPRKIARSSFKVLDAPSLQDDFYLNLVSERD